MSANSRSSCTTTGLTVNDSNDGRVAIQTKAMSEAEATASGVKLPLPSQYAGKMAIDSGIAAAQPSELRPVRVQPVDRKTITGSTPGNFRSQPGDVAAASLGRAADNGGVRQPVGQARLSKFETESN